MTADRSATPIPAVPVNAGEGGTGTADQPAPLTELDPISAWVDEFMPYRGPCGLCGGPDARHRIIDAICEHLRLSEPISDIADEFDQCDVFIAALALAAAGWTLTPPEHTP